MDKLGTYDAICSIDSEISLVAIPVGKCEGRAALRTSS